MGEWRGPLRVEIQQVLLCVWRHLGGSSIRNGAYNDFVQRHFSANVLHINGFKGEILIKINVKRTEF